MKRIRLIGGLGAAAVVAVTVSACGSGIPGNSVADMAGNPITLQAFNHWMYVAAKGSTSGSTGPVIVPNDPPAFANCVAEVRKQIPSLAKTSSSTIKSECGQLFTSLSSQVLDFLIRSYWYQADASKLNVKVTNAQVQQEFNTEKKAQFPTDAAFQQFLTQSGQTLDDILFRVRVNLLYQKLLKMHTKTVTPAEVAAYYNLHKSQFGSAETRNIRIVLAKDQADANAAKAALAAGQSWETVAKKYSTDATTKNKGGLLTGVKQGSQDAALDQAAFSAPVNKVIGPVKAQLASGYYVLDVVHVTPATQQTQAQATAQIEQSLTTQNQNSAQTFVDNAAKSRWMTQTTCRTLYSMMDCHGYKAPKTTSTSTAGSTAPATTTPTATTGG
jgi:parvulin-like peptidyl-prolyl isomerase